MANSYVRGRCLGAGLMRSPVYPVLAGEVYYAAIGKDGNPARYTHGIYQQSGLQAIPLGTDITDYMNHDLRRTVSVDTLTGVTPVALIMSLDGRDKYMEWGPNGDFERLALPAGLAQADISRGTFVADRDGLWHILYQDRLTDRIMCWDSVAP
jgi:hypothetical protein